MSEYWNGKKVCVTGGAGFVGVQLVGELIKAGAEVAVLDNWSRGKNRLWEATYVSGDATSVPTLHYAYQPRWIGHSAEIYREPVEIVFNLAATVAGVLHNQNHHHQMFTDNVNLQTIPLMVADDKQIPVFVQVSSVCVYDTNYNAPSVEDNVGPVPHEANAGYAWAKRMGEEALRWSNIERGVIVRPSNIFGPYDYFYDKAHVIPATIRKVVHEPVIHMYGPKDTVREFIFSNDVAKGMMAAAEFGRNKEAYNLGADHNPSNVVTMEELVDAVMAHVGTVKEVVWHEDVGGGDEQRWSDCTKAYEELHWEHTVDLHRGLKETIKWFEEHDEKAKV